MNDKIEVRQRFDQPINLVWQVITQKRHLDKWFYEVDNFDIKQEVIFKFYTGGEEQKYEHVCRIIDIQPYNLFSYTWAYPDIEGESHVKFKLMEVDINDTLLEITHMDTSIFKKYNFQYPENNFEDMWDMLIKVSLKEYIDNNFD